jgi:hypothetical protein
VQLIASTSANASAIYVEANVANNGFDTSCLLDIGTGASGSETALISNIAIGGARTAAGLSGYVFTVPIQVPSGTRISARIQHITASATTTILVEARDYGNYAQSPTSVDVIGTDTATSTGTDFVTANTYVQLTSSTSRAYRGIVILPNVSGNAVANVTATLTLAKGASGSEVELGARYAAYSNAETVQTIDDFFVAASVASGTRLAVKIQGPASNINQYGVCLIGIP